jgi:hypothetical protein
VASLVRGLLFHDLLPRTSTNILNRGCITPPVLHNWWESAGQDHELIDGLDTLPGDAQEKVKRALEQGHVDDDDFNGVCPISLDSDPWLVSNSLTSQDLECNRWNGKKSQGMFLTAKQKEALEVSLSIILLRHLPHELTH